MATVEGAYTGWDVLLSLLYEDVASQELPRDVLLSLLYEDVPARSSLGTSCSSCCQELPRDVLLSLLYEDVPSQELPRDVLYNLQASTYITFPAAQAEPPLARDFWARLEQGIRQQ